MKKTDWVKNIGRCDFCPYHYGGQITKVYAKKGRGGYLLLCPSCNSAFKAGHAQAIHQIELKKGEKK